MRWIDWLAIGLYLLCALGIGLFFVRRASTSLENYFVAGRSLRWWAIGLANCAGYTGASAAFVMLFFQDGLVGNFWWWPSWVVWMPLVAVLWARYWRRMEIVTAAEFIELRYGGRMAKVYRVIYALYSSLGWAPLITGYCTGWIVAELEPILGWSRFSIILCCGGLVLAYATVSGLFGVVYNQVFQFSFYLLGATLLVPRLVSHFGGWSGTLAAAVAARGPEFVRPLPPAGALTPETVAALLIMGFFFAAHPAAGEGSAAQRFMAAKNETHAAMGQMFTALLALVVRVAPFFAYGLAGAALFPKGSVLPEHVWSRLALQFAPAGLLGILVAAELGAYLGVANGFMNWGGSFLVNDIYKGLLRPQAGDRQLAGAGRVATVLLSLLSFLVTLLLVDRMMSWFLYINSVMIMFLLPLAWLRFFWWRLNVWGEAAGMLLGLPLGYVLWFPLGFSQRPLWLSFCVLFAAGWAVIVSVTLLTPAERQTQLEKFYARCQPPGWWGPVSAGFSVEVRRKVNREFRQDLLTCVAGILVCGSMVALLNALFAMKWALAAGTAALMIVSAVWFVWGWRRSPPARVESPPSPPPS